jgi:hypothetical protein
MINLRYNLKVWRNPPDKFKPTVNKNISDSKLIEWLSILIANIQAHTTDPLVHRIEIRRIVKR